MEILSDIKIVNNTGTYDDKMLKAFLQTPKKFNWYKKAFQKYNINGTEKIAWNWSWWAIGGGVFFLLYRRAYLAAFVFCIFTIITNISGSIFLTLLLLIAQGGFSTYFIYQKYKDLKSEIEHQVSAEEERLKIMQDIGGPNKLGLYAGVIVAILEISLIVFYLWIFL